MSLSLVAVGNSGCDSDMPELADAGLDGANVEEAVHTDGPSQATLRNLLVEASAICEIQRVKGFCTRSLLQATQVVFEGKSAICR